MRGSGITMAALLLFAIFILASTGHSSATWCVCKNGLPDASLQKTLDYACGAGADCNPIHQKGACYDPNTVQAHCSYAVNSYFQKKGQANGTCDFSGTASVTTSDPSYTGCAFPASASSSGTPTTTPTAPPSTKTPSIYTPNAPPSTTTSPYSTTTPGSSGILGGFGTGLGPSGAGMNADMSDGISMVPGPGPALLFIYLFALTAGLMMMD